MLKDANMKAKYIPRASRPRSLHARDRRAIVRKMKEGPSVKCSEINSRAK